jgi:hypothetical protein
LAALPIGVVAASAVEGAIRDPDRDDAKLLQRLAPPDIPEPVTLHGRRRLTLLPSSRLVHAVTMTAAVLDWLRRTHPTST